MLYAHEFSGGAIQAIIDDVMESFGEPTHSFVRDLVVRTVDHKDELDRIIREKAENWEVDRIAIIDRILLRIGVCEFLYFDDVPPKVSINEVIEIAKRYSTEKSSRFINGVLDSVYDDLRKSGRIQKSGRGILE